MIIQTRVDDYPAGHYIYALSDPRSGIVRYVGITSKPWERQKQHIWHAARPKHQTPKDEWIRELVGLGLLPSYLLLEHISHRGRAYDAERRWIQHFLAHGELLNATALKVKAPRYGEED